MNEQTQNATPGQGPSLTPEMIEALCQFFTRHPPKEFSKGLLEMARESVLYRHGGQLPDKLDLLPGFDVLYDALRLAAKGGFRPGVVE